MYCGDECRKGAYRDRQSGKPVGRVSSGITRPTAAQELARLTKEQRHTLADNFADQPEEKWRPWLPPPTSPADLRLSPLQLIEKHGPSFDVAILGYQRGSALAEFLEIGPEAFHTARARVKGRKQRARVPAHG